MGSPCFFTRQQAVKMGYFYRLRVKNSNHPHTELSLAYLEDTSFILKAKHGNIALFRTVPWLAWSPRVGQNTPNWELYSKKNRVPLSNFLSSSNMFFLRLFLANI